MSKISEYYDGLDQIEADNGSADFFKISPSQAMNFFTSPRQWFGENFLGEPGFEGSDATVLGTIVHYIVEQHSLGTPPENPEQDVKEYLDSIPFLENREEIESIWEELAHTIITGCIEHKPKPLATEQFMFSKLLPGIYVGGTTDAIMKVGDGTVSIRDYKTAATKPAGISAQYRFQAHIYAYLATKAGHVVSQIEIQYGVKPTKTMGCRHFSFVEPFTEDDLERVTSQLKLIADTVALWKKDPSLHYILAKDYRLKLPEPKKSIFK